MDLVNSLFDAGVFVITVEISTLVHALGGLVSNLLVAGVLLWLPPYGVVGFTPNLLASIASTSLFMGAGGLFTPALDGWAGHLAGGLTRFPLTRVAESSNPSGATLNIR
jgi:hypothetical protein